MMDFITDGTQRIEWMARVAGIDCDGVIVSCNLDDGTIGVRWDSGHITNERVPKQEIRSVPNGYYLHYRSSPVKEFRWDTESAWR